MYSCKLVVYFLLEHKNRIVQYIAIKIKIFLLKYVYTMYKKIINRIKMLLNFKFYLLT